MMEQMTDFEDVTFVDYGVFQVNNAAFKRDFGPWKKGETVEVLVFNTDEGRLEEYTFAGELVVSCAVKLEPV